MTLRIRECSDIVHLPVFQKLDNSTFRKLYPFPFSYEGDNITALGPLK
jgi:hypothetical protein